MSTIKEVTCGICHRSWDEAIDPAPSAMCHWCHGRGHSDAEIQYIVTYWNGERSVKLMDAEKFWKVRTFTKGEAANFVSKYRHQVEKMRAIRHRKTGDQS